MTKDGRGGIVVYKDLEGKTGIVTGSGKRTGIGYAIARKLASCGANVVIADLGKTSVGDTVKTGTWEEMEDIANSLAGTYGVKTLAVHLDVTDKIVIDRMVGSIRNRFERVDVLCNNAGASFGVPAAVQTYNEDAWMRTIDVNLHSVFRVSRAIIPLMTGTEGSIINTASRAGKKPPLFNGAYAVAKAGVIMLTKVMATELAAAGIRVNAICPGQIMTDLEKWRFGLEAEVFGTTIEDREKEMCKTIPLGRIGTPEEVANLVAWLASDESSYMTGQAINVTGGQLMEL
ncbi:MAG TPA: SDR family NAD(P)-dependent oxidoreductase [Syntrophales bacterium]|nr:SDR family NAD(P)-dependent oxidoreductase [Syntrophales bacterium]HPQ43084.1 SDR family NAD(P)-dependent oxidoreductase [Syntrophales bacterium]